MKDTHVYNDKKYKGNLLSIKSPYKHLTQLEFLLEDIFSILHKQQPGCLFIECSRPTYDYDLNDLNNEIKNSIRDKDIYFSSNTSEIRYSDNDFKNNEILDILPKLWFAYEHLCFRFTNVKNNNINDYYRKPWYEIANMVESYIVFKGIEEDVVWIGKSDNLEFKKILEMQIL
ncbi:TPA: hypothetical protein ACGQK4_002391 [Elizabethkingia anophelis]|uniref:hypothetical protein n=1 Tax=Elizabethkingia anophelis TaxID=1117645 RepID=UPI001365C21F|nr:hypothetical protein [Elizabethkingia anophelis]MCT3982299.1 hypothetical protein [Elizabethkingia anophelis]MDV4015299.1 hypothetical protein [Elizabethkingia anophelis]MVW84107.1 hypothetical protein [Elizabethkingia anophelis]